MTDYQYIDTSDQLKTCCQDWQSLRYLGLDTEFERSRTYFPRLALVQVCDGDQCYLIDPLAIDDLSALGQLIASSDVIKVIHSASEDVEVLEHALGVEMNGLFDSQRGAALAGMGPALSLRNLVHKITGVELTDDQTRSNWLKRPLTDKQLGYACDDVVYLPTVYEYLVDQLNGLGRLAWAVEDSERMTSRADFATATIQRYQQLKRGWRVRRDAQPLLLELTRVREQLAQQQDRPRRFVLEDDHLAQLAERPPESVDDIRRLLQMGRGRAESIAEPVLEACQRFRTAPESFEDVENTPPLSPAERRRMKQLKAVVQSKADSLNLEPALLASKKDLVYLLENAELPEQLAGWRKQVVGDALLAAL